MSQKDVSRIINGASIAGKGRAEYRAPVLSAYGSITELTRSGTISGIENSNGTSGGSCNATGNPNTPKRSCVK